MIELHGLSRHFGGVRAVDGLDMRIERGEIFGLIGPNGSGKSTTINLICGQLPPTTGRIDFAGRDISRLPAHQRAAYGVARTFQNIRLFGQLTVWENLWAADSVAADRTARNPAARWLTGPWQGRADMERTLESWGLLHKQHALATDLSFGEQRRLELACALATRPQLLLLDEPAAGMNVDEVEQLRSRILWLRERGVTIILVEHSMDLVMGVTDRIAVLNFGRKIALGTPAEVRANHAVRSAYLGTDVQ